MFSLSLNSLHVRGVGSPCVPAWPEATWPSPAQPSPTQPNLSPTLAEPAPMAGSLPLYPPAIPQHYRSAQPPCLDRGQVGADAQTGFMGSVRGTGFPIHSISYVCFFLCYPGCHFSFRHNSRGTGKPLSFSLSRSPSLSLSHNDRLLPHIYIYIYPSSFSVFPYIKSKFPKGFGTRGGYGNVCIESAPFGNVMVGTRVWHMLAKPSTSPLYDYYPQEAWGGGNRRFLVQNPGGSWCRTRDALLEHSSQLQFRE